MTASGAHDPEFLDHLVHVRYWESDCVEHWDWCEGWLCVKSCCFEDLTRLRLVQMFNRHHGLHLTLLICSMEMIHHQSQALLL